MSEYDDLLATLAPTTQLPPVTGGGMGQFPAQPGRPMSMPSGPMSVGNVGMGGVRDYLSGLGQAQQFGQNARSPAFNPPPMPPLAQPQQAPQGLAQALAAQQLAPSPTGKMQDRLPYEETPQQAPQERKAGREDVEQPGKAQPEDGGPFAGIFTPQLKALIKMAVQRDPSLAQNPARLGHMITKVMPFMHKQQQEQYQAARQAHTERVESLSQERADRAERMETYKILHDREKYVTQRMDKAFDRIAKLSDPLTEFAGDKKGELAKQQANLKQYEDELQSIVDSRHHTHKESAQVTAGKGEGVYGKGAQGKPGEAAPTREEPAGPPKIFQLQADDMDTIVSSIKPRLLKAQTLAEKEVILRNTMDHVNKQLQAEGKSPLSLPDANKIVTRLGRDAYDPRTYGEQFKDWAAESVKQFFPEYNDADAVKSDLGFAAKFYGNLLNPAEYLHMAQEGMRTAADTRPTTEQMLTNRARSGPERLMGGVEALGGVLGPAGMVAAPGASALGATVGAGVGEQTENPWLGLLAGGLAGMGAGGMGRGRAAGAAAPRAGMGQPNVAGMAQGAYSNPLQGMMGGKPFAPSTPGQGGSMPPMQNQPVPGMLRLPPPVGGPARSNVGPLPGRTTGAGPTTRPKAGLYGQPPFQAPDTGRAIEMPPPPEHIQRAEAAADLAAGKEEKPIVPGPREKPSRLQMDVQQFGDHTVGDTVSFRGKPRVIEELVPKKPGHVAAKVKLSGLKAPVSIASIEAVSEAKAGKFAEGDRVQWELPAGFGRASGVIKDVVSSSKGKAMAHVQRSDGQVVFVDVSTLKTM